jgi:nicotinamidase-related amidase
MKQALLVIDVQCGLFDAAPRPFEADTVVGRINALTARAREAGVAVVRVQHEHTGELPHGSTNWQLERNLAVPENDFRVRKTTPTHFCARRCRNCSRSAALSSWWSAATPANSASTPQCGGPPRSAIR